MAGAAQVQRLHLLVALLQWYCGKAKRCPTRIAGPFGGTPELTCLMPQLLDCARHVACCFTVLLARRRFHGSSVCKLLWVGPSQKSKTRAQSMHREKGVRAA